MLHASTQAEPRSGLGLNELLARYLAQHKNYADEKSPCYECCNKVAEPARWWSQCDYDAADDGAPSQGCNEASVPEKFRSRRAPCQAQQEYKRWEPEKTEESWCNCLTSISQNARRLRERCFWWRIRISLHCALTPELSRTAARNGGVVHVTMQPSREAVSA